MKQAKNDNAITISIVTPTLNRKAFLEKNLASVLQQGHSPIEHIVVDGLSTDGSQELLVRYEKKFRDQGNVLKWVSEKDRNHTAAVNKGFRLATGDYICFMYSDEYFPPKALQAAVSELQRDPTLDIVYGDAFQSYEDRPGVSRLTYRQYSLKDIVSGGEQIPLAGLLFRRTLLDRVGYLEEDLEYVAEHDFLVRCVKSGASTLYLAVPLAHLFEHQKRKVLVNIPASWRETKKVNFKHGASYLSPFYRKFFVNMYLPRVVTFLKTRTPRLFKILKNAAG